MLLNSISAINNSNAVTQDNFRTKNSVAKGVTMSNSLGVSFGTLVDDETQKDCFVKQDNQVEDVNSTSRNRKLIAKMHEENFQNNIALIPEYKKDILEYAQQHDIKEITYNSLIRSARTNAENMREDIEEGYDKHLGENEIKYDNWLEFIQELGETKMDSEDKKMYTKTLKEYNAVCKKVERYREKYDCDWEDCPDFQDELELFVKLENYPMSPKMMA